MHSKDSCQQYHSEEVHFLYDVACTLHRHLKVGYQHYLLLLLVSFIMDTNLTVRCVYSTQFHSFSIIPETWMALHWRTERLWSYLRRFCRMTKEMRRIDSFALCTTVSSSMSCNHTYNYSHESLTRLKEWAGKTNEQLNSLGISKTSRFYIGLAVRV